MVTFSNNPPPNRVYMKGEDVAFAGKAKHRLIDQGGWDDRTRPWIGPGVQVCKPGRYRVCRGSDESCIDCRARALQRIQSAPQGSVLLPAQYMPDRDQIGYSRRGLCRADLPLATRPSIGARPVRAVLAIVGAAGERREFGDGCGLGVQIGGSYGD
jgi:hypothetical protein